MDDDHDGPMAGPSRIESNSYQSSSILETPPVVSYPNLGGTGIMVKPQKLRLKESNEIVDCHQ
jgi:hypothetical protein